MLTDTPAYRIVPFGGYFPCRHYNGCITHKSCRAGVLYRDVEQRGRGLAHYQNAVLPCNPAWGATEPCPQYESGD